MTPHVIKSSWSHEVFPPKPLFLTRTVLAQTGMHYQNDGNDFNTEQVVLLTPCWDEEM